MKTAHTDPTLIQLVKDGYVIRSTSEARTNAGEVRLIMTKMQREGVTHYVGFVEYWQDFLKDTAIWECADEVAHPDELRRRFDDYVEGAYERQRTFTYTPDARGEHDSSL